MLRICPKRETAVQPPKEEYGRELLCPVCLPFGRYRLLAEGHGGTLHCPCCGMAWAGTHELCQSYAGCLLIMGEQTHGYSFSCDEYAAAGGLVQ